jgi:hypothetical protein
MAIHKRHLGLGAVLACLAGSIIGSAQAQEEGIFWYGDYHQALQKAKETGKPIFLEFRCEA